jgi:hypothetical protein
MVENPLDYVNSFDKLNFIDERLVNKYQPDSHYSKSSTKTIDDTLNNQNPMASSKSAQASETLNSFNIGTKTKLSTDSSSMMKTDLLALRDINDEVKILLDVVI